MPGFFPPISLLNISVYRLQPRLFIDSPPYLKKTKRTIKSYGSAARLDQAIVVKLGEKIQALCMVFILGEI
jgi:hypothetical protein